MAELGEKRNVILGITGSIAAYKSPELARILVQRGFDVRVIMTSSATRFISPLTMQSVTGNAVMEDLWSDRDGTIAHIELADWADGIVVAPCTADFMAKLRCGMADSALAATVLATEAPVLLAPAMNVNMFQNAATKENIETLRERGVSFVDPEDGALACGWNGTGRMASPWEIFHNIRRLVSVHDYAGRNVLIATGPTREAIDPVRSITNRSSGKMGVALAQEISRRGARVTLVHGPVKISVPQEIETIAVESAIDMREAVINCAFERDPLPDMVIMAAAVADYRPEKFEPYKMKKSGEVPNIRLVENPDILGELGKRRGDSARPLLVGFAVETGEIDELLVEARNKMERKNADMIVGNFAEDAFDLDTNRVWIVDKLGKHSEVATTFKSRVANKILDRALKLW